MIDSKYRDKYQELIISPLIKQNWVRVFSPAIFSFCSLFFGILSAFCIAKQIPYLALFFLILSGFFDTLDGSLARFIKQASPKGAALDITIDRAVEFALILGFYFVDPNERSLLCLCMLGSILLCITTFLVVGIFSANNSEKSFFYSTGIIERTEAFGFFGLMILFPSLFFYLALSFFILVIFTALIRIYEFQIHASKKF